MLAMERQFYLVGSELAEAIAMFEGVSRDLETDIFSLWVEIDSQIVWKV